MKFLLAYLFMIEGMSRVGIVSPIGRNSVIQLTIMSIEKIIKKMISVITIHDYVLSKPNAATSAYK